MSCRGFHAVPNKACSAVALHFLWRRRLQVDLQHGLLIRHPLVAALNHTLLEWLRPGGLLFALVAALEMAVGGTLAAVDLVTILASPERKSELIDIRDHTP